MKQKSDEMKPDELPSEAQEEASPGVFPIDPTRSPSQPHSPVISTLSTILTLPVKAFLLSPTNSSLVLDNVAFLLKLKLHLRKDTNCVFVINYRGQRDQRD